jgi:hypothetical protein
LVADLRESEAVEGGNFRGEALEDVFDAGLRPPQFLQQMTELYAADVKARRFPAEVETYFSKKPATP